ncbi:unnamed protein product [Gongylonema pulchrum]|uniref:Uncharacterized protein n=1 Tax=Gongylonema pulchrum TaxID=637853 RepID=A0A183CYA3_9BILA|nr:unnamed protein product [Gongylonema pulchrum]
MATASDREKLSCLIADEPESSKNDRNVQRTGQYGTVATTDNYVANESRNASVSGNDSYTANADQNAKFIALHLDSISDTEKLTDVASNETGSDEDDFTDTMQFLNGRMQSMRNFS